MQREHVPRGSAMGKQHETMYGRVRIPHALLGKLPGTFATEPSSPATSTSASRCLSREGRERALEDVGKRTPGGRPAPTSKGNGRLDGRVATRAS